MNNRRFLISALICLLAFSLIGCVMSGGSRVPGVSYPQTDPEKVKVFYQEPTRSYQVVGFVSIDRPIVAEDATIERKFRTVAATMGANAVIVDILPKVGLYSDVQGKGRAIRWK